MTTENIAVLFTDMVGSTALASSLTVDEADELRREHVSLLRQAVAEAGGTEVKNLGDGLMVAFATASAALSSAVAMQQAVERGNRARDTTVGLRVGLSAGEVAGEEGDYFGDPVIEAARLCARCDAGQIFAADVVRLMAGRRSRQECRPLGDLELKGLSNPVATVEVVWEPLDTGRPAHSIPLPARLAVRPTVGVVGRRTELSDIADAYKRVAAGQGRELLLISGEAGLGKTTLVAEATRVAVEDGACVLFGHCGEELSSPYQLFAEALNHYVTYAAEEHLTAHVENHGAELTRLVPALGTRIPDLPPSKATDSDTERFLMFAAAIGLLDEASHDQPVVLVLDDLHWADSESLALLRHLVSANPSMRLLVVGTYRDNELAQSDPLIDSLAKFHRLSGVFRIDLAGLDDAEVLAFVEAAAGQTLDDSGVGLAHALYRETDGNPFFVNEVLRDLVDSGTIYLDTSGRWVADASPDEIALPVSVREVIGARVCRLSSEAQRLLSIAAVIGRDFDFDILVRAGDISEDDALDALDASVAAALVREDDIAGRYRFRHALIQHTLYQDLGATRRARTHRLIGETIEEVYSDQLDARAGELARHWTQASLPVDSTRAVKYSRIAGDAALAALAPAEALRYYTQALDLYPHASDPDPVLALDLTIGLGTAQRQTGDASFRNSLLDAARRALELDDTDRVVAAALANNRGIYSNVGATDADQIDILEQALDRLAPDDIRRAFLLATLCAELTYSRPLEECVAFANEAVRIAETSGNEAALLRVLNLVLVQQQIPALLDKSLESSAESIRVAQRVGDPVLLFWAMQGRMRAVAKSGDVEELDRCIEIQGKLAQDLNQPALIWFDTYARAQRALIAGDTDLADTLSREALTIGTDCGQPDAITIFGGQLHGVSMQRGAWDDLIPLLEQMFAPNVMGLLSAGLAFAYADAGRIADAARLLEELATNDFVVSMDPIWLTAIAYYAAAAIECSEPRFAQPIFDLLHPWADQFATAGAMAAGGAVSHYLGGLATVLGRYEDADRYFSDADALNRRAGAEFFTARNDLLWAEMLADRGESGDRARAVELLKSAHTAASNHGYATVEHRAEGARRRLEST